MPDNTAVVPVNPLNDPLYVDGKANKILQRSLEANSTIENLKYLVHGARSSGIPIYYALHQEYRDSNFHAWKYMSKSLKSVQAMRLFEKGSQGAQIYEGLEPQHGDVVVFRHWQSSSFANTDLDFQLHQRQITHVILAELVANTCLESTARYARELGYHVTLLTDSTAGCTNEAKDAVATLVWLLIADEVTTVRTWLSKTATAASRI